MDEKYIKAFDSIVTFVSDLWETFGNPKVVSPLSLYNRIINHIKHTDEKAIGKVLSGFQQFFDEHEILNQNFNIPRGTVIKYGENTNIVIEIQKFIHKSDSSTKEIIRQHLVTISAIIEPNKEKIDELEKRIENLDIKQVENPIAGLLNNEIFQKLFEGIQTGVGSGQMDAPQQVGNIDTHEGNFITDIMKQAQNSAGENPVTAVKGLMNSGILQKLFEGIETGVGTGQMDTYKLLGSMQSAIGFLMSNEVAPTKEITDEDEQK
uniref:Uncharacterized protein n=1 Tax=Marseillevirus LCMAC102 TaxID=2506603 RepID=A0A481YV48_9VIRU|nr:MAG: uncharacterized protein LCMAC102_04620 [Marseillevirus LCMAC102]